MTLFAWLAALVWSTASHAAPVAIDVSGLEKFECPDEYAVELFSGQTITADCGFLHIPESVKGGKRKVSLAVAVLMPTDATKAALAPTIFLHGGPGGGVMASLWWIALQRLVPDRPMIVFDQRASGMSYPKLCDFLNVDNPALDKLEPRALEQHMLAQLDECLAQLKRDEVDLAAYDTDATVRDMEVLRQTLKIETWNLYGVSYGTTVALAYLAAHPARVRAAVVDSVYPPEMPGFVNSPADLAASLDAMNTLCAGQHGCRARFGDLRAALDQAIVKLESDPLAVPMRAGRPPRHMTADDFYPILQSLMMDPARWPTGPLLIDDVRAHRATAIVSQAAESTIDMFGAVDAGVAFAIECRERAPFDDRARLAATAAKWPALARASGIELTLKLCGKWPSKRERNWQTPRQTPVPTLVVAGAWDPVTPATVSSNTADLLGANSQMLIVPYASHGPTMDDDCLEGIVARFLASPEEKIDARCVAARRPPLFVTHVIESTSFAGLDFLPIEFDGVIVWRIPFLVLAGLISVALWPFAWVMRILADYPLAKATPFWARSSVWLSVAIASVFVWLEALEDVLSARTANAPKHFDDTAYLAGGLPSYFWPGFSTILVVIALAAVGGVMLAREIAGRRRGVFPLLHRAWVFACVAALIAALVQAKLVPQNLDHVLSDAAGLLAMARDAIARASAIF